MKYYISHTYDVRVGDMDDPSDEPYDGYSHEERYDHKFKVSKDPIKYPDATIETDIYDPVFVIVLYGDGGTFGRTDGYVQVLGAVHKLDVDEVVEMINTNFESSYIDKNKDPLSKFFDDVYRHWTGFFSSLEGVVLLDTNGFARNV